MHQHAASKLPCLVLSSAISCRSSICPGRLYTAGLVSLVVFSCHNYGLQVVTREVHLSSLRRLICPAQNHFISPPVLIISMTFVLSLTQMLVFLSLYVMLSILLSILVCAAASLFLHPSAECNTACLANGSSECCIFVPSVSVRKGAAVTPRTTG